MIQQPSKLKYIILLSIAPLLWGLGFVGVRWTLLEYSPTWSNAIRFLYCLPFVVPYLIFKGTFRRPFSDFKGPIFLGIILSIALWVQSIGIGLTTIAKAGFLTVLYAFFTPCIEVCVLGRKLSKRFWGALFISLIGVAILYELKWQTFNLGDSYVLLSAVLFSIHILLIDRYSKSSFSAFELNFVQIFVMFIVAFAIALIKEPIPSFGPLLEWRTTFSASPIAGFLVLSVLSNIIAYSIQVAAQKHIAAHIAGMVFLVECVAALFYGYWFFGESLGIYGLVGCLIILIALVLATYANPADSG